jgi:hypothetical protein
MTKGVVCELIKPVPAVMGLSEILCLSRLH